MLERIVQAKQAEIARLRQNFCFDEAMFRSSVFHPESLRRGSKGLGVIAEIKKASPSRGLLCGDIDPVHLAMEYQKNGASAVSVLTEREYFLGSMTDLQNVKDAVSIPVLRKDFILHEIQVIESACAGADMVLVIAALHPYPRLLALCEKCLEVGVHPLLEIHSRSELAMAMDLPATLIGVNNRDLRNFSEDITVSLELGGLLPSSKIKVSASSIRSAEDMVRMDQAGYDLVLIGEALVTASNPGCRLSELLDYGQQKGREA